MNWNRRRARYYWPFEIYREEQLGARFTFMAARAEEQRLLSQTHADALLQLTAQMNSLQVWARGAEAGMLHEHPATLMDTISTDGSAVRVKQHPTSAQRPLDTAGSLDITTATNQALPQQDDWELLQGCLNSYKAFPSCVRRRKRAKRQTRLSRRLPLWLTACIWDLAISNVEGGWDVRFEDIQRQSI
jgi:hypothetical protein